MITYQELREIAINAGISDNKVSIGIWAKFNGYFKKRKQINNKVGIYYFKINEN